MACEDLKTEWAEAHDAYMQSLDDRTVANAALQSANDAVEQAEAILATKQQEQSDARDNAMQAQDTVEAAASGADDAYTAWVSCETGISINPPVVQPLGRRRK